MKTLTKKQVQKLAEKFTTGVIPPSDLHIQISGMTDENKLDFGQWCDEYAVRAAMCAAYVSARGASGCGDHGHDRAVKKLNNMRAKIRTALGFAYPKNDITL